MEEERHNPDEAGKESLRVQKTAYLRQQLAKQREEQDALLGQLMQEQRLIDSLRENIHGDMEWMEESRRYNEELKESLDEQIYALHGISRDKLEGMRQYGNACFRGCAAALFALSAALTVFSGIYYGPQEQFFLLMLACTALEGTLLAGQGRRLRFLDGICCFLFILIFPAMLFLFICHELEYPLYALCFPYMVYSVAGVCALATLSYFLYNPYRNVKKKLRRARSQIGEIEKQAGRQVRQNRKSRQKEELRIRKKKNRQERRRQSQMERKERREQKKQKRRDQEGRGFFDRFRRKEGKEKEPEQIEETASEKPETVIPKAEAPALPAGDGVQEVQMDMPTEISVEESEKGLPVPVMDETEEEIQSVTSVSPVSDENE